MRKLFIVILISVSALLVGYAGYRGYRVWNNRHLITLGRDFLAKGDGRSALLALQKVLRSEPRNADAVRMMAELADATRQPSALLWHSRLVEIMPHSLEARLGLAQVALAAGDYRAATSALEGVDAPDKNTAAYQNLAGAVSSSINQPTEAEAHFLEAARLQPQNLSPQLNLAVLRLHGTNASKLAEGRSALEHLAINPTNAGLRAQSLRELTLDALGHSNQAAALVLSKRLIQEKNIAFSDKILWLEVLRDGQQPEFKSALASCQQEAGTNQGMVYALANWEMAKMPPREPLAWLHTLPLSTQTNQPITLLVAECLVAVQDWRGLQTWLEKQRWYDLEFIRHAFICRALRGLELTDTAKTEWEQSFKAANGQKQSLSMLLNLAGQWGWVNEAQEVLWTIVKRYPEEKVAAQVLTQSLYKAGQSRSLMQLFSDSLKRNPKDLSAKNNLAMLAMLLEANELKPQELARDVYQSAPTNAPFAATYAYSLYLQHKNGEALRVMQQLKPQELEHPSIAGYYAIILKATDNPSKVGYYLDKAAKGQNLPEEVKLFAKARLGP